MHLLQLIILLLFLLLCQFLLLLLFYLLRSNHMMSLCQLLNTTKRLMWKLTECKLDLNPVFTSPKCYWLRNSLHQSMKSCNMKMETTMKDEYLELLRNETWSLVPIPPDRIVIGCRWVFKIKENLDGTIHKYKAQLVIEGFHK